MAEGALKAQAVARKILLKGDDAPPPEFLSKQLILRPVPALLAAPKTAKIVANCGHSSREIIFPRKARALLCPGAGS